MLKPVLAGGALRVTYENIMKKSRLLKTTVLLGVCLLVGFKCGVRYGWLAGHTHWTTERIRERPYL